MLETISANVRAQQPPPYTPLVWNEDWSYLSDAAKAQDWSDEWKHFDLFGGGYISIGGQARERGEYIDYPGWGSQPPHNGYLLQRYLLNLDWHCTDQLRFFVQPGSSFVNGRDGGPRPGIDQSDLYLNQGFLDYSPAEALTIRLGRQLISLGSSRLFAIGAGLNVEKPFDGARVLWKPGGWQIDFLALRPAQILDGYFQGGPNSQVATWGMYLTHPLRTKRLNADTYYIGFDRKAWHFAQGTGREQRESFGTRIWGELPGWSWDVEATAQTGRFGSGNIRAWAAGYHLARRFLATRWTPRAEIDGGVTSGDHDLRNNTLGTFNPLFPNGSYLSESLLIGPYNVYLVRPKLELNLTPRLSLKPNVELLWRQSTQDGIYDIAGVLTHPGIQDGPRYVGWQVQTTLEYSFTRHLAGSIVYEHFFDGAFLKRSPPNHNVNFVAPSLTYTF